MPRAVQLNLAPDLLVRFSSSHLSCPVLLSSLALLAPIPDVSFSPLISHFTLKVKK